MPRAEGSTGRAKPLSGQPRRPGATMEGFCLANACRCWRADRKAPLPLPLAAVCGCSMCPPSILASQKHWCWDTSVGHGPLRQLGFWKKCAVLSLQSLFTVSDLKEMKSIEDFTNFLVGVPWFFSSLPFELRCFSSPSL